MVIWLWIAEVFWATTEFGHGIALHWSELVWGEHVWTYVACFTATIAYRKIQTFHK